MPKLSIWPEAVSAKDRAELSKRLAHGLLTSELETFALSTGVRVEPRWIYAPGNEGRPTRLLAVWYVAENDGTPIASLRDDGAWDARVELVDRRIPARVLLDQDGAWRVMFDGRLTSPCFLTRGPAQAYARDLENGARTPEWEGD